MSIEKITRTDDDLLYSEKITTTERMTAQEINEIITAYVSEYSDLIEDNAAYYAGENPAILERTIQDTSGTAPDNQIVMPYARKIINTVVGYMFKPGLITYNSDNEAFLDVLTDVFNQNREPIKSAKVGKFMSIHGTAAEIHYVDSQAMPRFAPVTPGELIPIYNNDIEPKMTAAIRFYVIDDKTYIDVYYPDIIEHYKQIGTDLEKIKPDEVHYYGDVPVVVFQNNDEEQGDFEHVKTLIDAYDVLISDSMNEFDRFAFAYLILKGLRLNPDDAETIKVRRIFEVIDSNGGVEFLTKNIPTEFIAFMTEWLKKEIHKQTHVPDFLDSKTGDSLSGVAISKLLYDFEFIAAVKESYFKEGLLRRIDLINRILTAKTGSLLGTNDEIEIVMGRNVPQNNLENAQIMAQFKGLISDQTLIENFAPFVKNAQDEVKAMEEQNQRRMPDLTDGGLKGEQAPAEDEATA